MLLVLVFVRQSFFLVEVSGSMPSFLIANGRRRHGGFRALVLAALFDNGTSVDDEDVDSPNCSVISPFVNVRRNCEVSNVLLDLEFLRST